MILLYNGPVKLVLHRIVYFVDWPVFNKHSNYVYCLVNPSQDLGRCTKIGFAETVQTDIERNLRLRKCNCLFVIANKLQN